MLLSLLLLVGGVRSTCIGYNEQLAITFAEFSPGDTTLSTTRYSAYAVNSACAPHTAMIFDSSNPTGGDYDLGTPNTNFDGPGVGRGGKMTGKGPNFRNEGNLLILSEDGSTSDPDDCANGGSLEISLTTPEKIANIILIDVDESVAPQIKGYLDQQVVVSTTAPMLGDNARVVVSMGDTLVDRIRVTFHGSGAISAIVPTASIVPCSCTSEFDCVEGFGCSCQGTCQPCNILGGTHTIAGCDACQYGDSCCPPSEATAISSTPTDACSGAKKTSFTVDSI